MRKLFLASDTITENLVPDFERLINRDIHNLKAAFILDAFYGFPNSDPAYLDEDREIIQGKYGWNLTNVRLEEYTQAQLGFLYDFDVLYVNGGASGYLAKAMYKSGFDKILSCLLNKG